MAFYKLGTREGGVNPTGNAVEANVLKDKTFSNASGINKIGTMPDNSTTTSNGTVPGINSSYPNIPIRPGSNLQMGVNTDGVKQLALEPPQGYYPGGGSSYIGVDADDLGDAVASDVVSGKTFTSESGIEVVGTMPNNGAVSPSALSPNGSYTIPEGYHNGNGVVSASPNTGTYSPTTRNAALDMGISNLNRYVNTNGVPNSNSGTYTFPANDTGGTKDLGATNTYRYVNASNVYNKGKADGSANYSIDNVYKYISSTNSNSNNAYSYTNNSNSSVKVQLSCYATCNIQNSDAKLWIYIDNALNSTYTINYPNGVDVLTNKISLPSSSTLSIKVGWINGHSAVQFIVGGVLIIS